MTDLNAEENQNRIKTLKGKVREKLKNAKVMLTFFFPVFKFTLNATCIKLTFHCYQKKKKKTKFSLNIAP